MFLTNRETKRRPTSFVYSILRSTHMDMTFHQVKSQRVILWGICVQRSDSMTFVTNPALGFLQSETTGVFFFFFCFFFVCSSLLCIIPVFFGGYPLLIWLKHNPKGKPKPYFGGSPQRRLYLRDIRRKCAKVFLRLRGWCVLPQARPRPMPHAPSPQGWGGGGGHPRRGNSPALVL